MEAVGVEGHAFISGIGGSCTEVRGTVIIAPTVTLFVTVTSVTRNKEAGVERMITDQQLVGVSASCSNTVPQSVSTSSLPIVSCRHHRKVRFSFEVGLVSCLVVNEDHFCELI